MLTFLSESVSRNGLSYLSSSMFYDQGNKETKWAMFMALSEQKDPIDMTLQLEEVREDSTVVAKIKIFILNTKQEVIVDLPSAFYMFCKTDRVWSSQPFLSFDTLKHWLQVGQLRVCCQIAYEVKLNPLSTDDTAVAEFSLLNISSRSNGLLAHFQLLFDEMPFTDVSIEVGAKVFQAHKVVLIARSPVFRDLFTKNHQQQQEPVSSLKISNMQPEVFGELLRFLYTDQVKNLPQYAKDLLGAADEYMLDMLKRKCEKVLTHQVSMENCLELLLLADRHSVPKLKNIVLCCIQFHVTEIVQTREWQELKRSHPQLYGDTADALLMFSNW